MNYSRCCKEWLHYIVKLIVASHHAGEERAGYFTLIAFLCHMTISVQCLFIKVSLVGLQFVIVAFPDHFHLHY